MTKRKTKVLVLGDHLLSPSGVGTQLKYIVDSLMKTGRYQVQQLGGALHHPDTRPVRFDEYQDDLIIFPVEGYGNPDAVRSIMRQFKPDILVFMTDPRFWGWLWEMENEVRSLCPMVYYHVWDGFPYPNFNAPYYDSNDVIATISKVSSNIVRTVAPDVEEIYLPHSVNTDVFKKISDDKIAQLRAENFPDLQGRKLFFWNNRNARRKQSGTLIFWFKKFLDVVGHDKATLIMHTDPKDVNGQDLNSIIGKLGLNTNRQVLISSEKLPMEHMAAIYNMVDMTINISDAEGFGLSTMESLATETPILVNMTGGLQEQVTDLSNIDVTEEYICKRNNEKPGVTLYEHGVGIEPSSKAVIGSQGVPYIFEDRLNENDFVNGLLEFYNLSDEEQKKLGTAGREHILKNFNFQKYQESWVKLMDSVHEKHGSWDDRKNYKSYAQVDL